MAKIKKDISKISFVELDLMSFSDLSKLVDDYNLDIENIDDMSPKKLRVSIKYIIAEAQKDHEENNARKIEEDLNKKMKKTKITSKFDMAKPDILKISFNDLDLMSFDQLKNLYTLLKDSPYSEYVENNKVDIKSVNIKNLRNSLKRIVSDAKSGADYDKLMEERNIRAKVVSKRINGKKTFSKIFTKELSKVV